MALPDWIERSLERLERLEAERERLVAVGPSAAAKLVECDTEIATLYEVLESAAGDEDADGVGAPVVVADEYTLTFIEHVGWTTLRDLEPLPTPAIVRAANDDIVVDEAWNGGALGWRFIVPAAAALLMFVAIGTWLGLQPGEAVASTPIEPATTVGAAAIPQDTQEPQVAKGIDADRTPIAQPAVVADAPPAPAAPRAKRAQHPRRDRAPRGHAIDLGRSREPLAGL